MENELKRKVEEMEEELENKEIMINALLNEIKKLKNEACKRRKVEVHTAEKIMEVHAAEKKMEICTTEKMLEGCPSTNEAKGQQIVNESWDKSRKKSLKEEVDLLLHHNKSNKIFRDSIFIEDFLDFCSETVPFNFSSNSWELKGPLKAYVTQNYPQITAIIAKEVNRHTLLQTCCTLQCISGVLSPLESCVVFHDILLMVDDYSKLHFIFHSLFKGKMEENLVGSTILAIMAYQQKVDLEFHKSKKGLLQQIIPLKYNSDPGKSKKLEDLLIELTTPITVFTHNMIDENIYQHVFSIRMLTHFLDWDYTFNTYVHDYLYPLLDESDAYLLFLGIINFNFFRLFGLVESTEMIFEIIKSKMVGVSSTSVLCYLLIKQIDQKYANAWLTLNTSTLLAKGWSIEYLSVYLLF